MQSEIVRCSYNPRCMEKILARTVAMTVRPTSLIVKHARVNVTTITINIAASKRFTKKMILAFDELHIRLRLGIIS